MEYHSIWEKNTDQSVIKKHNKLDNNTDVLIIGGGITGISTAYFLMNSNLKVMLIDKGKIGNGVTAKTTAKLSYLQGLIYQKLKKTFGLKICKLYLDSQLEAINLVKEIVKRENISCHLEKCSSFIFTKEKNGISKIKKEKDILEKFNIKCQEVKQLPIHFPIEHGIVVKDTYTFNPLEYLDGLANIISEKINICEDIMALEIIKKNDKYLIKTSKGQITSKYVLVTCHYPFFIYPGFIPIKTYIKREYVNASTYKKECNNFTALSIDSTLHSIRFYEDSIIYGSNQHRLTSKIKYKDNYDKSKSDFKRLFSKGPDPDYIWMNQDIMSNDNIPFIGRFNYKQPNLMIATAFNTWGMTNGTMAGKILSDLVLKNDNKYISLFNPMRIDIDGIIQSIIGSFHYLKIYTQTIIKKNPVFRNNCVYVVKINGKYYGVYYDNYGNKHMVKNKCPHMRCNLVFNEEEKTWDCPCHGSRFDIDGNVIKGPANINISVD